MSDKTVKDFLRESNAIEGVFGDEALEDALAAWRYVISQDNITKEVVLETHRLLMARQPLEKKYQGVFRDIDVYIGKTKAVNPAIVSMMVGDWCARTNKKVKLDAKWLHVLYERIHPFVDGNGRTGRIFLNWTRIKRNKDKILVIKNAEKGEYYKWFR